MEFYQKVLKAKKENKVYAVASVVQTEGNTPRKAGAKMLVLADGTTHGTVGGGIVEKQAIADCLAAMKSGKTMLKTYSAVSQEVADRGMVCGNNMTIFIEPGEQLPYLYLCGCGHVAQAVLPLAKSMGYYVVAIDARDISGYEEALAPADELHILESFECDPQQGTCLRRYAGRQTQDPGAVHQIEGKRLFRGNSEADPCPYRSGHRRRKTCGNCRIHYGGNSGSKIRRLLPPHAGHPSGFYISPINRKDHC